VTSILIVHQVPYRKVGYERVIDHEAHDVTYVGQPRALEQIPAHVRHRALPTPSGPNDDDRWFATAVRDTLAQNGPDTVDAVVSLAEFGHFAGAAARRRYGLPYRSEAEIERVRDKVVMKRVLAAAGIAVPAFISGPSAWQAATWGGKTVAKPRAGASSIGVRVFPTLAEAVSALGAEGDRFEYEEYIDGSVLHVDGFVVAGRLTDAVPSVCLGTPLEYAHGMVIASVQIRDPAAVDLAGAVVQVLGIDEGAIHLELFRRPDGELVFLELGHRVGGAGVTTAYRRRTGIDLIAREVCAQAGLPMAPRQPASGRYHGFLLAGRRIDEASHGYVDERIRPTADAVYVSDAEDRTDSYQEWEVPLFVEFSGDDPDVLRLSMTRHCEILNTSRDERLVAHAA
jgi:biotin carboxylase